MNSPNLVGDNIKRLRKSRKLTQAQVSEHAGIGLRTLQDIETGQNDPRLASLQSIAGALGVTLDELTGHAGSAPLTPSFNFEKPTGEDVSAFLRRFLDTTPDMRRFLVGWAFAEWDLIPQGIRDEFFSREKSLRKAK